MPIPKKNSKEWEAEVEFFKHATKDQREKRAIELGYTNANSYGTQLNKQGVVLEAQQAPGIAQPESTVINLPPVKLKKYKPQNKGRLGDPETAVLHFTDHHDEEKTPTYDHQVYLARLDYIYKSTIHIVNLHRNIYPVNDLVIPITGDMVHGENPYQGAKVEAIEKGVKNQIYTSSLPALSEVILSFKQDFLTVTLECVPGNHGRYSKESPRTSNWDLFLYEGLKLKLEPYGIKVNISNEFCKIFDVQGHKFFIFHGDQCRSTMGVPYFALTKKLMSWYVTYGGFDYAMCGHFHKDDFLRITSKCKLIMGASMVTDDPYALEVVGTSSIPSQWLFGVHKQKGITWMYSLTADDKYFPNYQPLSELNK